jgi:hypothetical protein
MKNSSNPHKSVYKGQHNKSLTEQKISQIYNEQNPIQGKNTGGIYNTNKNL